VIICPHSIKSNNAIKTTSTTAGVIRETASCPVTMEECGGAVAPGGHIQRRHFDLSDIITALSYSASLPRYLPTGIIGTSYRRILQLAHLAPSVNKSSAVAEMGDSGQWPQ